MPTPHEVKVIQTKVIESTSAKPQSPISSPSDVFIPVGTKEFNPQIGIGILGDSFYDEYQADDQRGGVFHAVTFNLVEFLVRTRNFNLGSWGSWGEPRRTGYEYNWARSGATSHDLIQQGQHTELAEQIRQGKVTYVFIGIGANDFSPYYGNSYSDIYDGLMTDEQLAGKIQDAIANVTLAADTVQKAGAKGIIVTLFTQWELDPLIYNTFPDSVRRQRVSTAIDAVNQGIKTMANDKGIIAFDQNALGMRLLSILVNGRYLNVGDQLIDFLECGDEPHYSRLADCQHLGTVMSGVLANMYFIEALNTNFGTNIQPISDTEILHMAGLR